MTIFLLQRCAILDVRMEGHVWHPTLANVYSIGEVMIVAQVSLSNIFISFIIAVVIAEQATHQAT